MLGESEPFRWGRSNAPKGWSFPITRTQFDAALADHPVTSLRSVFLWDHPAYRDPARYFRDSETAAPAGLDVDNFELLANVRWQGVDGTAYDSAFSAKFTIMSVESARRHDMRRRFSDEVLPLILGWLADIEAGPETRRSERHRLIVFLRDGDLETLEH